MLGKLVGKQEALLGEHSGGSFGSGIVGWAGVSFHWVFFLLEDDVWLWFVFIGQHNDDFLEGWHVIAECSSYRHLCVVPWLLCLVFNWCVYHP